MITHTHTHRWDLPLLCMKNLQQQTFVVLQEHVTETEAVPVLISKTIEQSVLGYIKCTDCPMLIIKPDVNTLFFAFFSI